MDPGHSILLCRTCTWGLSCSTSYCLGSLCYGTTHYFPRPGFCLRVLKSPDHHLFCLKPVARCTFTNGLLTLTELHAITNLKGQGPRSLTAWLHLWHYPVQQWRTPDLPCQRLGYVLCMLCVGSSSITIDHCGCCHLQPGFTVSALKACSWLCFLAVQLLH